jgi:hypothetical protein
MDTSIVTRGCNAIPKTVHLFSTAHPAGPEFRDSIIDGYDLSLTPDAIVYLIELMNGYKLLINNDL